MDEKMMILKMLQEGKITAEEASKLLNTVADESPTPGTPNPGSIPSPSPGPNRPGAAPKSGSGVDFDELGRKFAAFAKDWEPKVMKAASVVAETTVSLADKLSSTLEAADISIPHSPSRPSGSAPATGNGTEKQIELNVDEGYNELSLSGLNATVSIKGYNGDKISARINYRAKRHNPIIELVKLGNKYYLNYEEDHFDFVAIDAYVPSQLFNLINISGINGQINLSALSCQTLEVSGTNGALVITDITADTIKSESGNGSFTLRDINAKTAVFEHFNGAVESSNLDVEKLSLTNFNGPLTIITQNFARYDDYLWNVETSNAKLNLNVPSQPNLGYHIRAHATLGNIRLGLTGLEYLINEANQVEAQSANFASNSKKVRLALETSNAALNVN